MLQHCFGCKEVQEDRHSSACSPKMVLLCSTRTQKPAFGTIRGPASSQSFILIIQLAPDSVSLKMIKVLILMMVEIYNTIKNIVIKNSCTIKVTPKMRMTWQKIYTQLCSSSSLYSSN